MKIKEIVVSAKKRISSKMFDLATYRLTDKKIAISPPTIDYLGVKLSHNKYFEIQLNEYGDIVIKGGGNILIRSNEENELIFSVQKSS